MEWANFALKVYDKVGFTQIVVLILVLHIVGFFKFIWKKFRPQPEVPHKRIDDVEGDTHFHKRETSVDSVKYELESLRRVAESNISRIVQIEKTVSDTVLPHIEKEQEEHIMLGKMEQKLVFHDQEIEEGKQDTKAIFKILGEMKNMMIEEARRRSNG